MHSPLVHRNSLNGDTSVTLSASPLSVSFALTAGGFAVASAPIVIQATLNDPAVSTLNLYGFFANASAALTGSASSARIPTSAVLGWSPTGVTPSYIAFIQSNAIGTAGASLELTSMSGLTSTNSYSSSLWIAIQLSALPHLPADTYTGTLYLQAQAF